MSLRGAHRTSTIMMARVSTKYLYSWVAGVTNRHRNSHASPSMAAAIKSVPLATRNMKTNGIVAILTLVFPLFCGSSICNADGFDSVPCGSDVRKALLGRTMSNERIVAIEERHK